MAAAAPMIILTFATTTMQVVSQMKQSEMADNAASYNAKREYDNAVLSRQQAAEDERSFRVFSRKALGDIRTGYSASGVSLEGSAQDILEESAAEAEMDALRIKHGGEVKAQGFQSDATLSRMKAEAASEGGYFQAAGTLLGGAKQAYGYM